ncbi:peptidoglycan recognition protein family protein [Paenibacillus medicaginis]|uniref:Peptidoglycan recognition family protein n=1 Tax=Paenibacillus medicaginis TaxID=1470560 RepID=A0ABV5BV07_9BACL
MKQQGNFLLLECSEFREWLKKQSVTRNIRVLQVHHTASPNYSTRKNQDHFKCLEGMRNYHIDTNGWAATGQNITTFEDGKIAISLDRDLNKTPAGIRNFNTGCICIENIGNFDNSGDTITEDQRKTIVHLYACLAEKFNIPIDTNHIVYHGWFSYTGTRLSDYTPGKSSKTCPGTNFWGDGNTIAAAKKGFIPDILAEYNRLKGKTNINEDGQQMTEVEKQEFNALKKQVEDLVNSKDSLKETNQQQDEYLKNVDERTKALENKHSLSEIPIYAKEAIEALSKLTDKNGNKVIDTPTGRSADFYSIITVLYRSGLFK